jgi:hypothetical protein
LESAILGRPRSCGGFNLHIMENIFFDLKKLKYLGTGAIIGKTVRIRKPEEAIIGDYTIIDDFT